MKSKLIIELERKDGAPPIGIVGLAHDMHWVKRDIAGLEWTDSSDDSIHRLDEWYTVATVRIEST